VCTNVVGTSALKLPELLEILDDAFFSTPLPPV
jgi:hypothetical protein